MSQFNAVIENKAAFEHELNAPLPVFVVFMSHHCPACTEALPRFETLANRFRGTVKSLVLECESTPRHPAVTRIPMLLIYRNQVLVDTLEGLKEEPLTALFLKYASATAGTTL